MSDPMLDDSPFFRREDTLDALTELSQAKKLVVYCGAGVSIDRTGADWRDLVLGVFSQAATGRDEDEIAALRYLIEHIDDPRQAASVLIETLKLARLDENDFLAPKLHHVLYEREHWSRGYLLRNLVQFVTAFAWGDPLRSVEIITTNYDTFIEREFTEQYQRIKSGGDPALLPDVSIHDPNGNLEVVVEGSGTEAPSIVISYVHGRVDEHGVSRGAVVLSELSYANTRQATQNTLETAFSDEDTAVLIVGASLTDEPLLTALGLTKQKSDGILRSGRYALLTTSHFVREATAASQGAVSSEEVEMVLRKRGTHLGLTVLNPMSHYQSSQFFEELRVALPAFDSTGTSTYYRDPANGISYSARLERWAKAWMAREEIQDSRYATDVLRRTLDTYVRRVFKPRAAAGETFRAEIWARAEPRTNNRNLTLWANSTGPFDDRTTLRKEKISAGSSNASVTALTEGRPILRRISDLEFPGTASRWQTFFSVPIFVEVPIEIQVHGKPSLRDNTYIPAGVVTITSDHPKDDRRSALDSLRDVDVANPLKTQLIGTGKRILGVSGDTVWFDIKEEDAPDV